MYIGYKNKPKQMTIENFWTLIDLSWKDSPALDKQRQQAIEGTDYDILQDLMPKLEGEILKHYNRRLLQLSKEELTGFIHHLEERTYHIDRAEIQEYTDGGDDGFLYCRCFIVGMGQTYYNMIDGDPSKAAMDLDAELFGFSAYDVYWNKFNEEFERYSHHSMESCSNRKHWYF